MGTSDRNLVGTPSRRHAPGGLMRLLRWIAYKVRLLLLGLYGSPRLDDEHDPIVQLKKEHGEPARDTGNRP
jgi:hypothetical protein